MKTAFSFKFDWKIAFLGCAFMGFLCSTLPYLEALPDREDLEHATRIAPFGFAFGFVMSALILTWMLWPHLKNGGFFEILTDENGLEFRAWRQRKTLDWSEIARIQKHQSVKSGVFYEEISLWDANGEKRMVWFYPTQSAQAVMQQLAALETKIREKTGISFEVSQLPFHGDGVAEPHKFPARKWQFLQLIAPMGWTLICFVCAMILFAVLLLPRANWLPISSFIFVGILMVLVDSRTEINERGISRKSVFRKTEIAWDELQKVRVESGWSALTFHGKSARIRVLWPPKSDAEALLHFLESKRTEHNFPVTKRLILKD